MSVSVYVDCGSDRASESVLVAGQSAVEKYWAPLIESCGLQLLDVAFTGGLTVTEEYYEGFVQEVRTILTRFEEMRIKSENLDDVSERCARLLNSLERHPPGSGCEVYVG